MQASSLGVVPASLLVFESELHDLFLGATAGALNPLDVLVILVGCQDCLQLRVCDLSQASFGYIIRIYIYHRALVLKFMCIDAVLERNRNWVDDESIGM